MLNTPRLLVIVGLLVGSYVVSPELFAISAGVIAAYLVVRWRTAPRERKNRPVEPETLVKAASELPAADVRGEHVWTTLDDRPATVTLGHAQSRTMGDLPYIRFEVKMGVPIPFCFTIRRKSSLFPMPVLVWNTSIPRAAFEYELVRIPVGDPDLERRFEAAANAPRLMSRLWESRLKGPFFAQLDPHQLRLEELAFNGESLIFYYMPAYDLEPDPQIGKVVDESHAAIQAVDEFIRLEALRDATSA